MLPSSFRRRAAASLVLAAILAALLVACSGRDDASPATATPGGPGGGHLPLHEARTDLARRLDIPALDVEVRELRHAGWDGCAGVGLPGQACRELFGAGLIASFRAAGKDYRYHIFAGDIYATDFIKGATVSDGSPLPPELRQDLDAILAEYSRLELQHLRGNAIGTAITARITNIVPARWSSSCPGFIPRGVVGCTKDLVPGAVVLIAGSNGKTYRYHVGARFGIVATDFVPGRITMEPDARIIGVQQKMLADLASRLGRPEAELALKSYREVTWPDGCLGVSKPGTVCTQALVEDGFLAIYTGASGKEYRYHGAGDRFIAASFEQGATLTDPIFGE